MTAQRFVRGALVDHDGPASDDGVDGNGALFMNPNKHDASQTDLTGTVTLEGKRYRVFAWWLDRREGRGKFLKLKLEQAR